MKIALYSLAKIIFEGEAVQLSCFTPSGQLTVLDGHVPLITTVSGPFVEIRERDSDVHSRFPLSTGIMEVRPHSEIVVLVS
ncbi:MAG: hypothetical protein Q8Q94_01810 [bacterium]|nr:hypothetical protein [bacterium]MDZ4299301.1 hypothetical protein [Candidatus Sungbacteria bacterium]